MPVQLKIFYWFFSILLLISSSALAQQNQLNADESRLKKSEKPLEEGKSKKEKAFFERDIKFGWDVSNLLIGALSPSRSGLDFSVDYSINRKLYGIVEFGDNNYKEVSDQLDYFSNGKYFRLGIDSRMGNKDKVYGRDIFYMGARYAFASFQQRIENYQLSSPYWPSTSEYVSKFNNQAHWIETIAGFKVEVMKNMYLGLGIRIKVMIYQSGDEILDPAPFIPGYGKTSGSMIIGFNYNLYYNLPLNYSKKITKRAH